MQDCCLRTTDCETLVTALENLGLTVTDDRGVAHVVGEFAYVGQVASTPPTYHDGEYAVYRVSDATAALLSNAAASNAAFALVDPPAGLPMFGGTWLTPDLEAHEAATDLVAALIASMPGHYSRDQVWAAKTVSVAADRYTILSPERMAIDVGGVLLSLSEQQTLVLSDASAWDSTATDYTVAANRAGRDFYIYACLYAGVTLKFVVSANSTYPTGYTASTSRKIGGFHCLCAAVRHDLTLTSWAASIAVTFGATRKAISWNGYLYRCTTAGTTDTTEPTWSGYSVGDSIADGTVVWEAEQHNLEGYAAGDILPASVWDLKHRPAGDVEGRVWVGNRWLYIYMASWEGGKLVSKFGGTIADGGSAKKWHWNAFADQLAQQCESLPTQPIFFAASRGSNQGTNISGSADPGTTGGNSDTAGRRMISNAGCEDCCGALWQWLCEAGGPYAAALWAVAYDANDSGVAGNSYNTPNRGVAGGAWGSGSICGSRCSIWSNGPLYLYASIGARGVAETGAGQQLQAGCADHVR